MKQMRWAGNKDQDWIALLALTELTCLGVKFLGHLICTSTLEAPCRVKYDSSGGNASSWLFHFTLFPLPHLFYKSFPYYAGLLRVGIISSSSLYSQCLATCLVFNRCSVNVCSIYSFIYILGYCILSTLILDLITDKDYLLFSLSFFVESCW